MTAHRSGKEKPIHFSTTIEACSVHYTFGLDWRGPDAPAPLMEDGIAELSCKVREPAAQAGRVLNVRLSVAPDMERSLHRGGPAVRAVGHLVWAPSRECHLWLPSFASWWAAVAGIRAKHFDSLAFSIHAPLRGAREIHEMYLSGAHNDDGAEALRELEAKLDADAL